MRHARVWTVLFAGCLVTAASPAHADDEFKLSEGERPPRDPALKGKMPDYGVYEHLDKAAKRLQEALKQVPAWGENAWDFKPLHEHVDRLEKGAQKYGPERSDVQWVGRWVAAYRERVQAFEAQVNELRRQKVAAAGASEIRLVKGERPPNDPGLRTRLSESEVYDAMDKAVVALAEALPRTEEWAAKNWNLDELRNRANRIEKALAGQDTARSDVQWVGRWLTAYRARVESFAAEVQKLRDAAAAARAAAAQDVGARLEELAGYFDPKSFEAALAPPLSPERVRAWIEQLRQWSALPPKGLAELDRLVRDHPDYAKDDRIRRLRIWFRETMPKRIQAGIDRTMHRYETGSGTTWGHAEEALGRLQHIQEPGALEQWLSQNGADDAMVEELLARFPPAIEACQAKLTFTREYLQQPTAELEQKLARLEQMRRQIETGAKEILEKTRMPAAGSTSPQLLALVEKVLADPASEATPRRRLVIESEPKHEVEPRRSSWTEGDYIVIKTWTEEYDWFVVATAEKDGQDWRLCFYQLRRYTKALKGDSTHEWYCARRWWGRRIKEENIDK